MRKLTQSSIFVIIAVLAVSLSFVQCTDIKKKLIKAEVTLVNKSCPRPIDEITTLIGCKVLGDDVLEYTYSLSIEEKDFAPDYATTVTNMLKQNLMTNADAKKLIDAGIKLKYVYNEKNGKEMYVETFSAEDF